MPEPITAPAATPEVPVATAQSPAQALLSSIERIEKRGAESDALLKDVVARLEKAEKTQYPYGFPNGGGNGAHGIISGESPNNSRPFSFMRITKALAMRAANRSDWQEGAKTELDLCSRIAKAYKPMGYLAKGVVGGEFLAPLAADLMPVQEFETVDGEKHPGIDGTLVKECRDVMAAAGAGYDPAELAWIARRVGSGRLQKELSSTTQNIGGTLVAFPGQGELIELLRPMEVFSRSGAAQLDLPPQGAIRFPRITGPASIAAYAENATVAFSTPTTGQLVLQAKAYSGLVDIPEELLKFATSVAVEAWLRMEFTLDMAKQTDRDMIYGPGGTAIQGVINYANVNLVVADTTGANGNTLAPEDPQRMFAAVADSNAPVDRGFFYAMTNTLWAGLTTRKDTYGRFMFTITANQVDGPKIGMNLQGYPVIGSTNVPTNRSLGTSSNLTLCFGGVGPEWLIGRAGVIDLVVTNSDASKFEQRISTMRGTQYIDAGPRHEQSFVYIDTLLNQ